MTQNDILVVKGLKKYFPVGKGFFKKPKNFVKALDGVDLNIKTGGTTALVGESGCGKTTLGRCVLNLEPPTSGDILFDGVNVAGGDPRTVKKIRRDMQFIFQDPYSSLNPRMTVADIIGEGLIIHGLMSGKALKNRVSELMELVGLRPEYGRLNPHAFSGGQRQRICVARALALNPRLIIADEPVSALDVSIQAQILNLLVSLQKELGLTYLFISHDLSVVRHISDTVAVMYLGRIMEIAAAEDLYQNPFHPYSEALLSAVPVADPFIKKRRILLEGDVPSPVNAPSGCRFHPRCVYRQDICKQKTPVLRELGKGHQVACHFPRGADF